MRKINSGFTLLEIIIVLALMGLMLMSYAHYKQKQVAETAREYQASLLVQEMNGILKFANEDEVSLNDATKIVNNLYNKNGDNRDVYQKRAANHLMSDNMGNSYLTWEGANSERKYFTNKNCDSASTPSTITAKRNFDVDYIQCTVPPAIAVGKTMNLERIDLVGSSINPVAIERIDFIIKHTPDVGSSEQFYFGQYKPAFEQAMAKYKLNYEQAAILRRAKGSSIQAWNVIDTQVSDQSIQITLNNMSSYLNVLGSLNSYDYAIRFSFKTGTGQSAKSDGSVGVEKLCWNINKNMTGPCIETANKTDPDRLAIYSGTDSTKQKPGLCWDSKQSKSMPCLSIAEDDSDSDEQIMHLTSEKNGVAVTGTLMANLIIENTSNVNNGVTELVTVPVIKYQAFTRDHVDAHKGTDYTILRHEDNEMEVPQQTCPIAPNGRTMYPRLVAAISSIAADVGKDIMDNDSDSDFSNGALNRERGGAVGRLAGVALQVDLSTGKSKTWTVNATTGVYDNLTGEGINLINAKSLSVVLTSWCSTEEQVVNKT